MEAESPSVLCAVFSPFAPSLWPIQLLMVAKPWRAQELTSQADISEMIKTVSNLISNSCTEMNVSFLYWGTVRFFLGAVLFAFRRDAKFPFNRAQKESKRGDCLLRTLRFKTHGRHIMEQDFWSAGFQTWECGWVKRRWQSCSNLHASINWHACPWVSTLWWAFKTTGRVWEHKKKHGNRKTLRSLEWKQNPFAGVILQCHKRTQCITTLSCIPLFWWIILCLSPLVRVTHLHFRRGTAETDGVIHSGTSPVEMQGDDF